MESDYFGNMKKTTDFHKNKNEDYLIKNNSNISIHHRSKLRNDNYTNRNINEKENSYLLSPVYQTLKSENSLDNFRYKQSNHLISNKSSKYEEKPPLGKQNTALSLKTQTSFNRRIINNYPSNYNSLINTGIGEIKKVDSRGNYPNLTENNNISYNTNNINNNTNNNYNNKYILTSPKYYKNFYNKKISPDKSPETNSINPSSSEEAYTNTKNNKKYLTYKNKIKTVSIINGQKEIEKSEGKANYFEKKMNSSSNKLNNLENISNNIDKGYSEKHKLIKIKYNTENNIKNDKDLKYLNYIPKSDNKNFNNNFFHKVEIKSSNTKQLSKIEEKTTKNLNASFKILKTEEAQKSNISSVGTTTRRRNLTYLNPSNKKTHKNIFIHRFLEIINKIFYNRKYKYWRSIKCFKLSKQKSYSNYRLSLEKIRTYKNLEISPNREKIQINSTLDTDINYKNKYRFKKRTFADSKALTTNNVNSKAVKKTSKELNSEIIKLNSHIDSDKKLDNMKEQNLGQCQSTRKNNLINENEKLKIKLKNISLKYLINKIIYYIQNKLKDALHQFNKNVILSEQEDKKNKLLYKIININKNYKNKILRKFFFKFYYNAKLLFYEDNEYIYQMKQKGFIIKEKLLKLFYKKEKKELSKIKTCFYKLYFNSIFKKEKDKKNSDIIENGNININNIKNDFNSQNRKKKLKLILQKKINNNKMILRNIIKQWGLRTKIINMKIMYVKEENIKKIINPIENLLKNKNKRNKNEIIINNDLKTDNLIRGIKKLNNIFISYTNTNKPDNENGIHNTLKREDSNTNNIKREDLIYKMYGDKLKYKINDDWIIEEKEEEENGENVSFKNDNEPIIDNNINNINEYNSRINIENNENL